MSDRVSMGTEGRRRSAFAGSALIHAALALLLLTATLPQTTPRSSSRVLPVYVPAAVAPNPVRAPVPHYIAPPRVPTLALPPPAVSVAPPAPEVPRVSSPEVPSRELPRPRPVPPLEIEPGAARLSAPVPRVGAFDSAPPTAPRSPVADLAALYVGKFEPSPASPSAGGRRGPVVAAGFGSAATEHPGRASASEGTVLAGSFDEAEAPRPRGASPRVVAKTDFDSVDARPASAKAAFTDGRSSALEILEKPRPLYSEEARKLKIEGVVVLEVSFGADGHARVLRVVRGLGHGLDENAIRAATGIRFRPAEQQGRPVDTVAVVRIEFQVAY